MTSPRPLSFCSNSIFLICMNGKSFCYALNHKSALDSMRSMGEELLQEVSKDPRVPLKQLEVTRVDDGTTITIYKQSLGSVYNGIRRAVHTITFEEIPFAYVPPGGFTEPTLPSGVNRDEADAVIADLMKRLDRV